MGKSISLLRVCLLCAFFFCQFSSISYAGPQRIVINSKKNSSFCIISRYKDVGGKSYLIIAELKKDQEKKVRIYKWQDDSWQELDSESERKQVLEKLAQQESAALVN